jgi:hypothetical protein
MDDGGFFGNNKLYYFWLLKRFKSEQKIDGKIGYWLFRKEMQTWQKMNELKQSAATRVRNEARTANR